MATLTLPCAPQLFMDMAVLVESQGELLNQIEHNVEQAVGYERCPVLLRCIFVTLHQVRGAGGGRAEQGKVPI